MKYIILITLLFLATGAAAQPGSIDKTFGKFNSGVLAHLPFNHSANAMVLQPDGKFIFAGVYLSLNITFTIALIRCNENGELDSTFGINGLVLTPFSIQDIVFGYNYFPLLESQSDKLIICGSDPYTNVTALMRYNLNGTIDTTFGDSGVVRTNVAGTGYGKISSLVIQSDNKIIEVGSGLAQTGCITLKRFFPDGNIDTSFGNRGNVITTEVITGWPCWADAASLQDDGKIIVAGGYQDNSTFSTSVLISYNINGAIDSTFGMKGIAIRPSSGEFSNIAVQPDNKIVAIISAGISSVVRYLSNGQIDKTFGKNGVTTLFKGDEAQVGSLFVDGRGKIICLGYILNTTTSNFTLERYNSDGTVDLQFGTKGITQSLISTGDNIAIEGLIESDSKIIVAGTVTIAEVPDLAIVRYDTNGIVDNAFSPLVHVISHSTGDDEANTVSISLEDDILLGGHSDVTTNTATLAAIRYKPDGEIDSSFWKADFGEMYLTDNFKFLNVTSSLNQLTTSMYLAGYLYDFTKFDVEFALLQYRSSLSFESISSIRYDFGGGSNYCQSLLEQPDGKFILSGYAYLDRNYDFALLRCNNTGGGLDSSFGVNGMVTTDLQVNQDYAYASALQSDGKIILAGTSYNDKQWQIALVRYNGDGSIDHSFGNSGIVLTAIHDSDDCAKSVQVQSDGKIVVAGFTRNQNTYDVAVLRYNINGTLDSTFGKFGIAETPIGTGDAKANGMVIQSNGKIVIAGYSSNGKDDDFMVACYSPAGYLDNSFGIGGITTTDYGFGDDHANAVALQSDGSIIVAGYAFNGTDKDYAVARYLPDLSLGVIDRKNSQTIITIYPNPIYTSAKLDYELTKSQPVTIKLFDILGNERAAFVNKEIRNEGNNSETIIFPEHLAAGSYYLTVETAEGKTTVKVIKQ